MRLRFTYRITGITYTVGADKALIFIPAASFDSWEITIEGAGTFNVTAYFISENLQDMFNVTKTSSGGKVTFDDKDGQAYFVVIVPDKNGTYNINLNTFTTYPV